MRPRLIVCRGLKTWKTAVRYLRQHQLLGATREPAHKAFKRFGDAFVEYNNRLPHYVHMLMFHPEFLTGPEGESCAVNSTQGNEYMS